MEDIKRMKRQASDWKKIFTNNIPNKEFVPNTQSIRKQLSQIMGHVLNRYVTKEDAQMTNKYMKNVQNY